MFFFILIKGLGIFFVIGINLFPNPPAIIKISVLKIKLLKPELKSLNSRDLRLFFLSTIGKTEIFFFLIYLNF